jgi:hypothetical protein
MTIARRSLLVGAAAFPFISRPARAEGAVDLQLVLAVDTSGSVSQLRFILQRSGYADAFRSRDVAQAIASGRSQAIAVCMTFWTGYAMQTMAVPWTRVTSAPQSLAAFANAIDASTRTLFGGGTSVSGAIDHGVRVLYTCPLAGPPGSSIRRVIDVSGDGRNNRGRPPAEARDAAVARDITINGLPILEVEADLAEHYEQQVIGGQGAFLIAADDFESFGVAVRRKLVQEIG